MPGVSETPHLTPARRAERQAREARLARALRDNLRRRKAQARARETREDAAPHPPAGKHRRLERRRPLG